MAQWLRKYIFFTDDVQIKDVTGETGMISLYGAAAQQADHGLNLPQQMER